MDTQYWHQIDALLDAALALPPSEREPYLLSKCPETPEVRSQVRALLQAADSAKVLGESVTDFAESLLHDLAMHLEVDPLATGDVVGPYRIVRHLADGGMSAVYLAERADEHYEQRVALKVVKRGMDSAAIIHRFQAERQILARLEHPNIARLYDGGLTSDGLPYLVMEYVEGVPITTYCRMHRLSITERVQLLQRVSKAVQVAHQNLIVHRDLKPTNILVTEKGTVKLLDFGIAKLLAPSAESYETQSGGRLLTPDYAAPEQYNGKPITTATDVYALGLLLYEVLTDRRPYPSRTPSSPTGPPKPPSLAITEAYRLPSASPDSDLRSAHDFAHDIGESLQRIRRRLSGDLDTIILKALRLEPERRYASAELVGNDLDRYMNGLPVTARKDSALYRLRKFVTRHVKEVAFASVLLLLLIAYAGTVTQQNRTIEAERDRAARERNVALRTTTLLSNLFAAADPYNSSEERRDTLRAADLLQRGVEQARIQLRSQPDAQAALLTAIGLSYRNLARYEEADSVLHDALNLLSTATTPSPIAYGNVQQALGRLYFSQGHFPDAQQAHERAIEYYRRATPSAPNLLSMAHGGRASALNMQGAYREALADADDAIEYAQTASEPDPFTLGQNIALKGMLYYSLLDTVNTTKYLRQAQAVLAPHLPTGHPLLTTISMNLALVADPVESERLLRDVLASQRARLGIDHPATLLTLYNLASALAEQGRYAEAEPLFLQAVDRQRAISGPLHLNVAQFLFGLSDIYEQQTHYETAASVWREIIRILSANLPDDHVYVVMARAGLGMNLAHLGRIDEAEPLIRAQYEAVQRNPENGYVTVAEAEAALHWIEEFKLRTQGPSSDSQ